MDRTDLLVIGAGPYAYAAAAFARENGVDVRVDGGPMFKRIRPRARGMAHVIKRRTAHIQVALD